MKLEDLHFWEKYWVFVVSIFSGIIIGFVLNDKDVSSCYPILVILWLGLPIFHLKFKRGTKSIQ